MTPTERLILENQIAIMNFLRVKNDTHEMELFNKMIDTLQYLRKSDTDGGR